MYRINYFSFNDYSGAWIVILPPLEKIWKPLLTVFTTTAVEENNQSKTGGYDTYIR
jgi:hypothetical protein